ncbi:MAG: phosphotransferase [Candidatus Heimdallarchaeota archaeon]|nr:phosphotransferase [Candidatus Heimdallarchaeota archaeon]
MINNFSSIPQYTIEFLQDLTHIKNMQIFNQGESVFKFIGDLDGKKVMLRYLNSSMLINDRINREIDALNFANQNKEVFNKYGFTIPKVINTWKKENLIALEYIEGSPGIKLSNQQLTNYIELMTSLKFEEKYTFQDGVLKSLSQIDLIQPEYHSRYISVRDEILNNFDFSSIEPSFIHGDFHIDNLILTNSGRIGIIDWEYASQGSIYFDLAYYKEKTHHVFDDKIEQKLQPWVILIDLILTHWSLYWYSHEPVENEKWLTKVEGFVNQY